MRKYAPVYFFNESLFVILYYQRHIMQLLNLCMEPESLKRNHTVLSVNLYYQLIQKNHIRLSFSYNLIAHIQIKYFRLFYEFYFYFCHFFVELYLYGYGRITKHPFQSIVLEHIGMTHKKIDVDTPFWFLGYNYDFCDVRTQLSFQCITVSHCCHFIFFFHLRPRHFLQPREQKKLSLFLCFIRHHSAKSKLDSWPSAALWLPFFTRIFFFFFSQSSVYRLRPFTFIVFSLFLFPARSRQKPKTLECLLILSVQILAFDFAKLCSIRSFDFALNSLLLLFFSLFSWPCEDIVDISLNKLMPINFSN